MAILYIKSVIIWYKRRWYTFREHDKTSFVGYKNMETKAKGTEVTPPNLNANQTLHNGHF